MSLSTSSCASSRASLAPCSALTPSLARSDLPALLPADRPLALLADVAQSHGTATPSTASSSDAHQVRLTLALVQHGGEGGGGGEHSTATAAGQAACVAWFPALSPAY